MMKNLNLAKSQASIENNANSMQQRLMDQSKVPAAMRTSVFFGDVKYEDDIKKTKELERKKWLLELEVQKKENLIHKEFGKERDRLNDLRQDLELHRPQQQQQQQQQRDFFNADVGSSTFEIHAVYIFFLFLF
jgi:hypothetical protein